MGQHKANLDKGRDSTRERNNVKVLNSIFAIYGHHPREIQQSRVRKHTRLPRATVSDVFKRLVKAGRMRKVSSREYELTYKQFPLTDGAFMSEELKKQIEQRRKEIEVRESKRFPEAYPLKPEPPWFKELKAKKIVKSGEV
jgi:DNA-binding MarR family transcriptional regulator